MFLAKWSRTRNPLSKLRITISPHGGWRKRALYRRIPSTHNGRECIPLLVSGIKTTIRGPGKGRLSEIKGDIRGNRKTLRGIPMILFYKSIDTLLKIIIVTEWYGIAKCKNTTPHTRNNFFFINFCHCSASVLKYFSYQRILMIKHLHSSSSADMIKIENLFCVSFLYKT